MKGNKQIFRVLIGLLVATIFLPVTSWSASGDAKGGPSIGRQTDDSEYKNYSVNELRKQAGMLNKKLVSTYGYVDYYEKVKQGQIRSYILKGDEGGKILIRTTIKVPELYKRVHVKGILTLENTIHTGTQTRFSVYEQYREYSQDTSGAKPPIPISDVKPVQAKTGIDMTFIAICVAGLMVAIVVVVILVKLLSKNKSVQESQMTFTGPYQSFGDGTIKGGGVAQPANATDTVAPESMVEDSEITVKRSGTTLKGFDDSTIKYLPGHLEIIEGGQIGDKIPLCGGNAITIGRVHSKGKGPTFIGLEDPSRELSRCQAIISYEQSSGKFYIEQKGVNVMSLDNQEIAENETKELQDGTTIHIPPEYSFKFKLGR